MADEEKMMQMVIEGENEDFKRYAAKKLRWVKILQDMGYTTDQAIKLMIYFCLNDISDTLGPDKYGCSVAENLSALADCIDETRTGKAFRILGDVSTYEL